MSAERGRPQAPQTAATEEASIAPDSGLGSFLDFILDLFEAITSTELKLSMAEVNSGTRSSIGRLILGPALITLAVTLLRLVGELSHWPKTWFNPAPGGPGPMLFITTVLAPIFGAYFAFRLARIGEGPGNPARAFGLALLGAVMVVLGFYVSFLLGARSTGKLELGYLMMAAAAALQFPAWSRFSKTQAAYALSVRIPIVVITFLALRGHWGTHFDNVQARYAQMGFWPAYLYFALLPQLVFWVSYTVVSGSLLGTIAASFVDRGPPQATS